MTDEGWEKKFKKEEIKRMEINKGDRVKYIDVGWAVINGRKQTAQIHKFGTWDGEKVILEDKEKTTVRNKEWLENMEDPKRKRFSDWNGDGHIND